MGKKSIWENLFNLRGLKARFFPYSYQPLEATTANPFIPAKPPWQLCSLNELKLPAESQIEVITGYRAWVVGEDGKSLYALFADYMWPKGFSAIGDLSRPHQGLYAWKDKTSLAWESLVKHEDRCQTLRARYKDSGEEYAAYSNSGMVVGEVAMWGSVVCHAHGYRAEYAYPQRLYSVSPVIATNLRNTYGCETEVVSLSDLIERWTLDEGMYDGLNDTISNRLA